MANSIIDMVYEDLQRQIKANTQGLAQVHTTTEQAGFSDNVPAYLFADLPTDGLGDGIGYITIAWVTNGRKGGEGAGSGTGVMCYFNPSTSQWFTFSGDILVTT